MPRAAITPVNEDAAHHEVDPFFGGGVLADGDRPWGGAPCAGRWDRMWWSGGHLQIGNDMVEVGYAGVEMEEEETKQPSDNLNNSTVGIIYLNAHVGYIQYILTKCMN